MADTRLVDYYAVLSIPPTADLMGIENAYAHLSDALATRVDVDDSSREALFRLNEAYGVLSKPEVRREYDRVYFSKEIALQREREKREERKRRWMGNILVGALVAMILFQAAVLYYVGRDSFDGAVDNVVDPLVPNGAGD